jgi:NAD(P)-dependent dehydrogenase (short-subunit alcohol dehydrogenase family)
MSFLDHLFSLEGKTAVIIGGGGILGSKMAEGLARAGAAIALIDPTCERAGRNSPYGLGPWCALDHFSGRCDNGQAGGGRVFCQRRIIESATLIERKAHV